MTNKWIYDKVKSLIRNFKSSDPEILAKELDICIRYISNTKSLLGLYTIVIKNRYIFLAKNLGSIKKIILAHELGHDVLHKKYCKNGASFYESKIFDSSNKYEIEANIFAAHLLISDEDILNSINNFDDIMELASFLDVDMNLLIIKINEMIKLNLLNLDISNMKIPDSQFLKEYKYEHY